MKIAVVVLTLAMTGCATVAEIERTPPTLSVISGKSPQSYADCLVHKLAGSRKPPLVEPHHDGLRMIISQNFNSDPAAVVLIESRSNNGSSIKLYEHLSNVPIRPKDVQNAATACISG
ncbi:MULTISPECIES: hypothetical protein [unclassified Pseudomonas]|uniref:hypothetical protein n=1 Tax=unclassified Pseudomonas TaxID=196821 RepID=UPI002AC97098|nr:MULTISPECIES: hypothetical protein [unclassified Pseudomonas]MEB0040654.1 hypothetical protein [Pseudomonas sp. MH10]MEB0076153.1 hypothetical protein [Pseudomonas sp. MH10out]MEB0090648.1 hypothetical protein [Pseudomonas sp. CCI4.2]MEB0103809.1 hypothetical protein [Pseudomonas sp. CCI3.2]MEB0119652.1 hypothetical protein [Pseudomonas sp. CCI1.2]